MRYYEKCRALAYDMLEAHERLYVARCSYITSQELHRLVETERGKYSGYMNITREEFDRVVWKVAMDAYDEAFAEYAEEVA